MMKHLFFAVMVSVASCGGGFSEEEGSKEDAEKEKLVAMTKQFWSEMTGGEQEKARKKIMGKNDDSRLANAENYSDRVAKEFRSLVRLIKPHGKALKVDKVELTKFSGKKGQEQAEVILMVWEPDKNGYSKLSIGWLNTDKGGWKIMDL